MLPTSEQFARNAAARAVLTAGSGTPGEQLQFAQMDFDAVRHTHAWNVDQLTRLRAEHPGVAAAMPPLIERGMRWRMSLARLPSDEQNAALRLDEHERTIAAYSRIEPAIFALSAYRAELRRGYRLATARRYVRAIGSAPRMWGSRRPRARRRRFSRSSRRTSRGSDDGEPGPPSEAAAVCGCSR